MQNKDEQIIQIITDKQFYLIGKIHTVINKLKTLEQQYSTTGELIASRHPAETIKPEEIAAK
jgi:hypothetical protein